MPRSTGPSAVESIDQLEDLLSEPTSGVIDTLGRLEGDVLLLGAGGKMGPTLARMARRASDAAGIAREVFAASRFSKPDLPERLQRYGVRAIRCDLSASDQLNALPDAANVVFMTGMKFGSASNQAMTWMTNVFLPGLVCQRFAGSRIVVLSTGNVYGLSPVVQGGSTEVDDLQPVGEYAMSALGRERIFEHFSRSLGIPITIVRLNYANELRYGVLADLARAVWNEEPVDLQMGAFNAIWQADASAMTLQSFGVASQPPRVVNVAGPELLSVRRVAGKFADLLSKPIAFRGQESADALISNAQLAFRLFGYPRISPLQMIEWIAEWVRRGGENLGRPTHFQVRDGGF